MNSKTLLIELGTEELPPTALKSLSDAFADRIYTGLSQAGLLDEAERSYTAIAAPRRIGIVLEAVLTEQASQVVEKRGPAVAAAFDQDGKPTQAAQGFASSCGVEVADLNQIDTPKGKWLAYSETVDGKPLNEVCQSVLDQAIKQLPIPKRMRWGSGDAEFVRPVHWLLALHGDEVLELSALGLKSGDCSNGHRFHHGGEIKIDRASDYFAVLERDAYVIADFSRRQEMIQAQINELADSIGAHLVIDQDLLDEVTGLVEYPNALLAGFDTEFLEVPAECLVSAMRDHQKYFHLNDKQGKLLPNFITVSNIESSNPERVIAGNERVINARLSDARFFWVTDCQRKLESYLPQLDAITFNAKFKGEAASLGAKSRRLKGLANEIAGLIGADQEISSRAALLAKADLPTNMVGEFDKLQGIMGRYYADLDGEHEEVGKSIEQHYWPRYAGDRLPESKEAQSVALADRIDTLVGIFASGDAPTGDKDPFSLRRAALGVLRILIEHRLSLALPELLSLAVNGYENQAYSIPQSVQEDVLRFIDGRYTSFYQAQGISTSSINAVLACQPTKPMDFDNRLQAVKRFNELEGAVDLAAANKRISNILKKLDEPVTASVDENRLVEVAERNLFENLLAIEKQVNSDFNLGDYQAGLQKLAALRSPVDEFFEHVMVMSDDAELKLNRLALLARLRGLFLQVADIALLQA